MRERYGVFLDIRDREWFLTQRNGSAKVQSEAESFCSAIADPFTTGRQAIERKAQALSDLEAKAAFVYLGLQWEDDTREKGLTKLCFEAMVRAVLRDTTADFRMPRAEIHEQIARLAPAHDRHLLDRYADSALARLTKVHIRHWRKQDEFCLTWDERARLATRLTEMEALDAALTRELAHLLETTLAETGATGDVLELVSQTRRVLERVLLDRGEAFATAVSRDQGAQVRFEDIEAVVYRDLTQTKGKPDLDPRLISAVVQQLLLSPSPEVRAYLRSLADTYTLFAFMRETPDVQSAVVKIFSDGDIWLDTTVVLPLLAEELLEQDARLHTRMIRAAVECGLKLYVTPGVIEEAERHINRSESWARPQAPSRGTRGDAPFLYSSYKLSGLPMAGFEKWLSTFRGSQRPEDDIADYLLDVHGIDQRGLREEVDRADAQLKAMVAEIWYEARERTEKKREAPPLDPMTRRRLVEHDVENYVGVLQRREGREERRSPFGYRSWWLTLDRTAFAIKKELEDRITYRPPASPAISPDFMLSYLAVGPVRRRLARKTEETLPLMLNMSVMDAVPTDLLQLADQLRDQLADLPPHVVNRKIRDTLDEARRLLGPTARGGEAGLTEDIRKRLVAQALDR